MNWTPRPLVWEGPGTNVTIAGPVVTKTDSIGWSAGVRGLVGLQRAPGRVSFRAPDSSALFYMFGLTDAYTAGSYAAIRHAYYSNQNGPANLAVWEYGNQATVDSRPLIVDEVVEIRVTAAAVQYWRRGVLLWTSALAPVFPLFPVVALFSPGASLIAGSISGGWS